MIEVRASQHPEEAVPDEMPEQRVVRLAREKATVVLEKGEFSADIEVIVAADTEVVLDDSQGHPDIVAHPGSRDEAIAALRQLAGREHVVMQAFVAWQRERQKTGK